MQPPGSYAKQQFPDPAHILVAPDRDLDYAASQHEPVADHAPPGAAALPRTASRRGRVPDRAQRAAHEYATLDQSLWDICVLLGCTADPDSLRAAAPGDPMPVTSTAGLLMIVALVSTNAAIQILMSMAILNSMTTNPYSPPVLDALASRRDIQGHAATRATSAQGRSYVSATCNASDWSYDESQYARLRSYLSPYQLLPGSPKAYDRSVYAVSVGEVVSGIAILLWTFSMLREFRSIAQIMTAVVTSPSLPSHAPTLQFKKEVDEDPVYFVTGFTRRRKAFVAALVALPRLGVAVLLLVSGSLYLANTIALNDLILNAMALAFVKDVDELMFSSLVAEETAYFVSSVAPLRYRGTGYRTPGEGVRLLAALGYTLGILLTSSTAFFNAVTAAEERLCGGEQAFVHQHHPDHGLPVFGYLDEEPSYQCYYKAYEELVAERRVHVGPAPQDWSYLDFAGLTLGALSDAELQKYCGDHEDLFAKLRAQCRGVGALQALWEAADRCPRLAAAGYCNASIPKASPHWARDGVPEGWGIILTGVCGQSCGYCAVRYGADPTGEGRARRREFGPQAVRPAAGPPAPDAEAPAPGPRAAPGAVSDADPPPPPTAGSSFDATGTPKPSAPSVPGRAVVRRARAAPSDPGPQRDSRPAPPAPRGPPSRAPAPSPPDTPLQRRVDDLEASVRDLRGLVGALCWALGGLGLALGAAVGLALWLCMRRAGPAPSGVKGGAGAA